MSRLLVLTITTTLLFNSGCGEQQQQVDSVTSEQQPLEQNMTQEDSRIAAAITELTDADRKTAETQKMCPVSDQPLGSMGTPIKVTVGGRDVYVCCASCVDELKSDFEKYVAKLEN